jgi:hypothetical protein
MRARKFVLVSALFVLTSGAVLVVRAAMAAEGGALDVRGAASVEVTPPPGEAPAAPAEAAPAAESDEMVAVPSLEGREEGEEDVTVMLASERAPVPAQIRFRNQVGRRLRLVGAEFWIDGRPVQVPAAVREAAAEKKSELLVFSGPVQPGSHVVTTRLMYQGAQRGPFTYVKGYRFNVENVGAFVVPPDATDAAFTIVGEEAKGAVTAPAGERLRVRVERNGAR